MLTANEKKQDRILKITLLITAFMMLMAAVANVLWAEEVSVSAPAEKIAVVETKAASEPQAIKEASESSKHNPLRLRITPTFGVMRPAISGNALKNKYAAGFSAEVPLTANVSIEGVFRYALFDVNQDPRVAGYAGYGYAYPTGVQLVPHHYAPISTEMRQITVGGNIKYELFPEGILSPYVGAGISYFNNEYLRKSVIQYMRAPQSLFAASGQLGLKLRLAKELALVGQAEGGTLLNNRYYYYGQPENFRAAYNEYWTALAGISFGL